MSIETERRDRWFPFRLMLEKAQTESFSELCKRLIHLENEYNDAQQHLSLGILQNRERREGKPVKFTRAAAKTVRNFQKDSTAAESDLVRRYSDFDSEIMMLEMAFQAERFDLQTWAWFYESLHPDDQTNGRKILQIQNRLIDEMEAYLVQHRGSKSFIDLPPFPKVKPKTKKPL